MMEPQGKTFDCIAMKREIQERIYEDTKQMNHEQYREYIHNKIRNNRFAFILDRPVSGSDRTAE